MFSLFNFSSIFRGVSWPHLPLCADPLRRGWVARKRKLYGDGWGWITKCTVAGEDGCKRCENGWELDWTRIPCRPLQDITRLEQARGSKQHLQLMFSSNISPPSPFPRTDHSCNILADRKTAIVNFILGRFTDTFENICFPLLGVCSGGRLSLLASAFERTLKQHLVSYRIMVMESVCSILSLPNVFRSCVCARQHTAKRRRKCTRQPRHVLACNFAKYSIILTIFTDRLSNKLFSIWLLTTPPHPKYVATLPWNWSLIACFLILMFHKVARQHNARCDGIFSKLFTANLL